jgi:hypothetical protein
VIWDARRTFTLPDEIIGTSGCQPPECVREEFERPLDFVDLRHPVQVPVQHALGDVGLVCDADLGQLLGQQLS